MFGLKVSSRVFPIRAGNCLRNVCVHAEGFRGVGKTDFPVTPYIFSKSAVCRGVPLFVGCKWASSSHPPQANRTRTRSRQRARNFGIGTNGADGRSSKIPSWPDATAAMLGIHFNGAAPSMDKDRTVPPLPLGASTFSALRRNGEVYVDFGRKKAVHGLNRRRLIEASRSGFV